MRSGRKAWGDPAFYRRVGFKNVSETDLPAPQPLQQPQGWIAQSLTEAPLMPKGWAMDDEKPWRAVLRSLSYCNYWRGFGLGRKTASDATGIQLNRGRLHSFSGGDGA
jgi:hypothetical protein